ncbi:MAG: hypothetical protein JRI91_03830 [Deltaproteobacteria bacterium]|nr:hypothetical protein [Deltaproteobacteria bacterium]
MKLQEFWAKFYPADSRQITIASNNGHEYLWLRKTDEWMYLADANGSFRAAKGDENLFKVIVDWMNSIKADKEKVADLKHSVIVENISLDSSLNRWIFKS